MRSSFPSTLESAYQNDLADQKRQSAREGALLAALLYTGFALLDIWAMVGGSKQAAISIAGSTPMLIEIGNGWPAASAFMRKASI